MHLGRGQVELVPAAVPVVLAVDADHLEPGGDFADLALKCVGGEAALTEV